MTQFILIIYEITFDIMSGIGRFIKNNLRMFANILNLLMPYTMYFVGHYVCETFGYMELGEELLIPLGFMLVIYYLRSSANKLGKGITIPVPNERFTQVDEDGEVSMENRRIQELLLYTADLEDWLERRGLL